MELWPGAYFHIVVICIIVFVLYLKFNAKWCKNAVCLVGKTVIITGANKGIGYEAALDFAKRGARVILACRNKKLAADARDRIIKLSQNNNVVAKYVDFASLKTIREFCRDVTETEERLDILVNNVGYGTYTNNKTEDGFLEMMQINYYGHVLLTVLLIDLLRKSGHSRIVNVASLAAIFGSVDPNNLNKQGEILPSGRLKIGSEYGDAKLAMIYFTQRLAELLQEFNICVVSLHPGSIETDLIDSYLAFPKFMWKLTSTLFLKNPQEGAQTTIYTATELGLEKYTGRHFDNCTLKYTYPNARNVQKRINLFTATLKILGLEDEFHRIIASNHNT